MKIGKNVYSKNKLILFTNPDYNILKQKEGYEGFQSAVAGVYDTFEDISYERLNALNNATLSGKSANTIYVCDMVGKSCYSHLEYLEISVNKADIYMTAEVNFKISEWTAQVSPLTFTETLRSFVDNQCGITSKQENLFDEDLLHIKFNIIAKQNLPLTIQRFAENLQKAHKTILRKHAEEQLSLQHNGRLKNLALYSDISDVC